MKTKEDLFKAWLDRKFTTGAVIANPDGTRFGRLIIEGIAFAVTTDPINNDTIIAALVGGVGLMEDEPEFKEFNATDVDCLTAAISFQKFNVAAIDRSMCFVPDFEESYDEDKDTVYPLKFNLALADVTYPSGDCVIKLLVAQSKTVEALKGEVETVRRIGQAEKLSISRNMNELRVSEAENRASSEAYKRLSEFHKARAAVLDSQNEVLMHVLQQYASKEAWAPTSEGRNLTLVTNLDNGYDLAAKVLKHPIMDA